MSDIIAKLAKFVMGLGGFLLLWGGLMYIDHGWLAFFAAVAIVAAVCS